MPDMTATSPEEVAELRKAYMASLAAPMDGMWEVFIASAAHWEIRAAGERAGYFCVNDEWDSSSGRGWPS